MKQKQRHCAANLCLFFCIWAASWENQQSAYAKTKTQISFAVTAKLISAFVFATWIVQSLYFLNTKFQASSHLQWLHSLVCVRPGQNPHCWFSRVTAHLISTLVFCYLDSFFLAKISKHKLSNVMRKSAFCQLENKEADQLRSICNCTNDLCLCFCYIDWTFHTLSNWASTRENQQCWFWLGLTQTRLYSYWSWPKAWNFRFSK